MMTVACVRNKLSNGLNLNDVLFWVVVIVVVVL